jgi:uncharacterized membrane protein
VTVSAEIPGRGSRFGWAIWIALALSLTLNVFIAGGLFWSMMGPHRMAQVQPADRLIAAARSLDLNADQQTALQTFARTARELRRSLNQTNGPIFRQVWAEMSKAQPDQAAVTHLVDTALDNRRVFQEKMSANLMAFLATLNQDQRDRFVELATRRPGGPPPRD